MNKSTQQRREFVDQQNEKLSMRRQCDLLSIHRSGLYYKPIGESEFNLELMRLIDEESMRHPFKGSPQMCTYLREDLGLKVNHKRVERLYRLMALCATVPGPNTSKRNKAHRVYPYLLRKLKIERPMQAWAMDITYILVQGGYLYLCAVIDLYSCYIVGWSLSNTMEALWCKSVVEEAVKAHGTPEIINTDQGSQFTSEVFSQYVVKELKTKLSMDGKGRAIDNVFIERFWRTLKYEQVYLYPSPDGIECYRGVKQYIEYYNDQRRHSSIGQIPPVQKFLQLKSAA